MDQRPRLFIYDRKEMGLLIVLGTLVAAFAFTLGVHLGKSVGNHSVEVEDSHTQTVTPSKDRVPTRPDFADQEKKAVGAADETLFQELHEEVGKSGVQLNPPRQVKLPEGVSKKEHAAAEESHAPVSKPDSAEAELAPALERAAPNGRFTLQVGSYPEIGDAKTRSDALEAVGIQPFIRQVNLGDKGKWYRVYVGGFLTGEQALNEGRRHQQSKVIESFIVAKMPQKP